ncbi:hypothetical protein JTB14_012037 [Gonioctena quinquepunctata]|nr:hypothetical protein JTB14_012037 [Gonioctena quinquepunctata]
MAKRNNDKPFSKPTTSFTSRKCANEANLKNLSVFHQNVQSLNNKVNNLEAFICDKNFDIVCLSELWLSEEQISALNFYDLQVATWTARETARGGGTGIFIKPTLEYKALDNIKALSIDKCIEVCGIFVKELKTCIILVYRSPTDNFETFLNTLNNALNQISVEQKIILLDDFNVHFCTEETECTQLCDLLGTFGLKQTIFKPTRKNNCLDNIFVNFEEPYTTNILYSNISDHENGQLLEYQVPMADCTRQVNVKYVRPITEMATYKEALYNEGKLAKTDLESDGDSNSCIGVIQKRRKKPNRKYRDDSISPPPDLCGASSSNKSDDNISLNSVDINSAEVIFAYPNSNDNYQERQIETNMLEQEKENGNEIVKTVDKFDLVTPVTEDTFEKTTMSWFQFAKLRNNYAPDGYNLKRVAKIHLAKAILNLINNWDLENTDNHIKNNDSNIKTTTFKDFTISTLPNYSGSPNTKLGDSLVEDEALKSKNHFLESLRNKIDELFILLENHKFPDFVTLTEHWLREEEPAHLSNYISAARFNRISSPHGGTIIFMNDSLVDSHNFVQLDKFDNIF